MTDSTLNRFLASGTNAERLAFTPVPPTPGSGPDPMYIWTETDTNDVFVWDPTNTTWIQINVAGTAASTTEVLTGTNTTKFVSPDALAALWEKGSDEASAGTVSIGEGGFFHVTGTTTITDIDFDTDKAGRSVILVFDGILTLTHNGTTLILPTGANITTAAGDTCCVVSEGSDNVRVVWYMRKDGTALAGGSGSGALTLITETVTSGSATDVTFSSISSAYRDLEIRIRGRGDTSATEVAVWLQFNSDTGNNYHACVGVFNGSIASSASSVATSAIKRLFDIPAATATTSYSGTGNIVIGDYRGTTFFKSVYGIAGLSRTNASTGTLAEEGGGIWLSTSAITSVKVFLAAGGFVDNTVVSLYGRT